MKVITVAISSLIASVAAFFTFLGGTPANAYNVGDAVADFKLKSTDGRQISLASYKPDAKGYIVVFTCNHCPYSKAYEDRVVALDKKFAPQGYAVIAINPSSAADYDEDSFEAMKTRAKEKGFTFPYTSDETQEITKAFGATKTPHAFVLKKEGDKFVVQYIGAIDDSPQDATGVTKRYIEEAVGNLLSGKPVMTTTTRSVGCSIRLRS